MDERGGVRRVVTRVRAARPLGVVLAVVTGTGAAFAEPVPLSLAQALELAAQGSPEFLAERARTEAEAERTGSLGRLNWPRLSLATGWSVTDTPATTFAQKLNAGAFTQEDFAIDRLNDPDALSHLTTTLAVEVPLDLFGRLKARIQAQSSGERAAGAMADEALQDLRLRVVEAYRRAALATRVVEVTERALAGARAREADVATRVAEGASLGADLLRARARRRQREADLAERRADAGIAAATLARVLGAEPGATFRPTEFPEAPPAIEGDVASWAERGLLARPSLVASRERQSRQAWAVRAEERSNRPELAAWGQLQDDRNTLGSNQSGALGVLLRWNAFDPTRGKRVAAAAAEARAADLEARSAAGQLRLEVETAWRRAAAARERHAAAAGGAEEGREALRVVQERRREGMATLTDELETEAAFLAAELEELRAASEAAIADAALLRAAGAL
jgi:outer membrane protein TolC